MRKEIINLLKKENKLSDETISEIENIDLSDFSNIVKDLGKEETQYIKASEISKDLNTDYIGKNLYVYKEVTSTNTVARFLSMNGAENGSVIISEKQTNAKGRSGKAKDRDARDTGIDPCIKSPQNAKTGHNGILEGGKQYVFYADGACGA